MDALQWMGAVRMRVQTADKNITIIHKLSTPLQSSPSVNIFWRKKLHVYKKQLIKIIIMNNIINLKPLFLAKIWLLYPYYCFF